MNHPSPSGNSNVIEDALFADSGLSMKSFGFLIHSTFLCFPYLTSSILVYSLSTQM